MITRETEDYLYNLIRECQHRVTSLLCTIEENEAYAWTACVLVQLTLL